MRSVQPEPGSSAEDLAQQVSRLTDELASANARAGSLGLELRTSRRICAAIGILMHRHKITDEQAFSLLRVASQHAHRKLQDIAEDVCATGELDLPHGLHRTGSTPPGPSSGHVRVLTPDMDVAS